MTVISLSEAVRTRLEEGRQRRNALVERNLPLVSYVVGQMAARDSADPEEMQAWGLEGLIRAAAKYDPERGVSFATYALHRIRGSILDGLRQCDHLPRPLRTLVKRLEEPRQRLTELSGRPPSDEELAAALGVSVQAIRRAQKAEQAGVLSLDGMLSSSLDQEGTYPFDVGDPSEEADPQAHAERALLAQQLRQAVRTLPPRLQVVLRRCFVDERSLRQIGRELGVSPSRISQLRQEAVELLRANLAPEGETPEAA